MWSTTGMQGSSLQKGASRCAQSFTVVCTHSDCCGSQSCRELEVGVGQVSVKVTYCSVYIFQCPLPHFLPPE